ncbi:MAG: RagB/SusD family nutrient uptake outer membrane protein [Bacteroidales bacterium]|nr:RagB/SusD family nutrient uptake outer membrane protein [Bacteroidales bacterium]MBR5056025.1 RagB/SusD family nutrient uptake outer membrane protein [Bacteroidales bacterium]
MKKIYILLASVLVLASCNDGFLDKTPLDKLSEDAVFNSDALAEAYVNALYTVLPDPYQEGNVGCITDEGYFRYGGTSTRYIASGYMDPDNVMYMKEGGQAHNTRTTVLNIWNRTYEWIHKMNYFLQYIEEKGTKMTEEGKTRLMGEVYYLRAWSYFLLIQRYAGVPIIKKPFALDDDFTVDRANFDDCVDFILDDLDKAYNMLPEAKDAVQGRVNKDVVLALRCRLTLVAASLQFNDPAHPTGDVFHGAYSQAKWQRAFEAAKAIVDRADVDGAYSLDDTYDGFWKDINSPEVIWAKYFVATSDADDNYTKKAQLLYTVEYYNGWEAFHPTQAAQIDFEMTNGKKWFEEGSGYDETHPYANRDPRFYYCIAAPFYPYGSTSKDGTYSNDPLLLYYQYDDMTRDDFLMTNNAKEPAYTSKAKQTTSGNHGGLELYKWYIPTSYISESQTGSLLYPWFRLGEMYLNYAEAAYRTGREDICREYINKIRHRPDVMMPDVTESGEFLWDRLVNERRVELYAETIRYFDLRRWKMADFYENVPLASAKTMVLKKGNKMDTVYRVARLYDESRNNTNYYWANTDASKTYTYAAHDGAGEDRFGKPIEYIITYKWLGKEYTIDYGDCILNQNPTPRCFPRDGRNYLMPIPRNEITKSEGKLTQNPGY